MDYNEFADKIKAKYPDYADMDNRELAQKMVAKFPNDYGDVTFDQQAQPDTWLNRAADVSSGVQDAVLGPVVRGVASGAQALSRTAFGTEAPANMVGQGIQAVGKGIKTGEEYVSGKLGEMGVNPYIAGAVPIAGEIAASMLLPGPKTIGGKFLKPTVPLERQAAVSAAREASVPLTRAEMTGGRLITGTENLIEKTPLGSGTMQEARSGSDAAMQAYKERLQSQMGTNADLYQVGKQAQTGIDKTAAPLVTKKNAMFEVVPENVHIPLDKARNTADQIIQEQSQYLPTTRNSDVIAIAKDVQNAHEGISGGKGVTGGPDKYGEVTSVSPETQFAPKPNYQLLKRLRETLGGKAQDARNAGQFATERDYLRLKSSVDADINSFVENQKTPLGSMIGKEFADRYQQANAFSGAYKQLFKGDTASLIADAPPEKVLGMVFQKNNETAIKQFHALVGDDAFQTAKQKWVNDILESPNVSKELTKYKAGTLRAVLSQPELNELQKYGSVQGIRKTVGNLQGTQGSARSNIALGSYGMAGYGLKSFATGDFATAAGTLGQFLAPYPISKVLTSKAATEGVRIVIPGATGKTAMVLGSRALLSAVVDRFVH